MLMLLTTHECLGRCFVFAAITTKTTTTISSSSSSDGRCELYKFLWPVRVLLLLSLSTCVCVCVCAYARDVFSAFFFVRWLLRLLRFYFVRLSCARRVRCSYSYSLSFWLSIFPALPRPLTLTLIGLLLCHTHAHMVSFCVLFA